MRQSQRHPHVSAWLFSPWKRLFDIAVSLACLVVLGPVMLLLGFVICKTSTGTALFRQTRIGQDGRHFTLLKFRTMTVLDGTETGLFQPGETDRITPIGKLLRITKLDELPGLWNVLTGEMSLVGPRPEVPEWVEVYPDQWALAHLAKPGVTDQASIAFRNEQELLEACDDPHDCYRREILPHKLIFCREYVSNASPWGDLKILLLTMAAVLQSCLRRVGNTGEHTCCLHLPDDECGESSIPPEDNTP